MPARPSLWSLTTAEYVTGENHERRTGARAASPELAPEELIRLVQEGYSLSGVFQNPALFLYSLEDPTFSRTLGEAISVGFGAYQGPWYVLPAHRERLLALAPASYHAVLLKAFAGRLAGHLRNVLADRYVAGAILGNLEIVLLAYALCPPTPAGPERDGNRRFAGDLQLFCKRLQSGALSAASDREIDMRLQEEVLTATAAGPPCIAVTIFASALRGLMSPMPVQRRGAALQTVAAISHLCLLSTSDPLESHRLTLDSFDRLMGRLQA